MSNVYTVLGRWKLRTYHHYSKRWRDVDIAEFWHVTVALWRFMSYPYAVLGGWCVRNDPRDLQWWLDMVARGV
jgi:hypothetical protein